MNSVILIGRLARDPELSYTANTQTAMCQTLKFHLQSLMNTLSVT